MTALLQLQHNPLDPCTLLSQGAVFFSPRLHACTHLRTQSLRTCASAASTAVLYAGVLWHHQVMALDRKPSCVRLELVQWQLSLH